MAESNHKTNWTQIITAVAGAIVVTLQGANLAETGGQTDLIKRVDTAIEQQTQLIKEINQEGARIDNALTNQVQMIEQMDGLLKNQSELLKNQSDMIEILKKEHT
jgi:hypothetical protein